MKKHGILLPIISILLATLFLAIMPTEADAAIYEDTVRLHILAESDSTEHQHLKLIIRDKVIQKYGHLINACENKDQAELTLAKSIQQIEADCAQWISEAGFDSEVSVTLDEEWYNTREYANFTLPSGIYSSLKIEIGGGEGQNWWCVMYPPLCLDVALKETNDAYTESEKGLISNSGYKVKFKLLEVASAIFRR